MAYQNRWRTKADILKDLSEVTCGLNDVDKKFIIEGKAPPPIIGIEEDTEELDLRFGNELYDPNDVTPPDLEGISAMLRMVNDYENENDSSIEDVVTTPTQLVVVSKLNPEVPEFVPRAFASPNCSVTTKESTSPNDSVNLLVNNDFTTPKSDLSSSNSDDVGKICTERLEEIVYDQCDSSLESRLDLSKLNAGDIEKITEKLHSKTNDQTIHRKSRKEKNVAMANILQTMTPLLANNLATREGDDIEPKTEYIKLLTPDYFITCPAGSSWGENTAATRQG